MSYSFKMQDGDLALLGDQLDLVQGIDKLSQDIELALRERYGGDRFHTNYGSVLEDFIGGIVSEDMRQRVIDEVERVLLNIQEVQADTLKKNPAKLSESELLYAVDDIRAQIDFDTVNVAVRIRNGHSQTSVVTASQSV